MACRNAPGLALRLLLLQRIGQVDRRVEPHSPAMTRDAGHADGRGQVRLAGAGSAHQHGVVRRVRERQLGQRLDQLAVHRRDLEVEARQVAVHRELGRVHLVAHRAHGAVRGLCLQQMLKQPARSLQRTPASTPTALLHQIGPRAGHAVHTQLLEFDGKLTHGRPPRRCRPAGGRSARCQPAAWLPLAAPWRRSLALARRSAAPAR